MDINTLVAQLVALAGVGTLIAVLVNLGKQVGIVKDGQAPIASTALNLAALVGLFLLKVFKPETDPTQLDAVAAQVAQLLTLVFGLFVQLGGAKLGHELLKGVPVVGKSFSAPK